MRALFTSLLLSAILFCNEIIAQPPPPPGNPSGVAGEHAPVGADIGDALFLLIFLSLLYGTYRYYRFYKEHFRIDKSDIE